MPKKIIVERNIEESVKLRRRRIAEIEEEEKTLIMNRLNNTLPIIEAQSDMSKKLRETEGKKNEDQIE